VLLAVRGVVAGENMFFKCLLSERRTPTREVEGNSTTLGATLLFSSSSSSSSSDTEAKEDCA